MSTDFYSELTKQVTGLLMELESAKARIAQLEKRVLMSEFEDEEQSLEDCTEYLDMVRNS